ncbi:hypothetical protein ACX3VT_01305 [Aerococcus sanguinicola]|uniref:hypothetical protein n=1 Tax=unclassified Aerococcus TaxID=2618060 RepID=UPI0008A5A32C|nr:MULTISPECIES: hypothetical protein [unclassified Aerococcus]MDK6856162.1 hypothetical protein [Aerococcus sp. UMB7533]OFN02428.1 hypothetical protein HMPREF2626_06180 [Aerococcus sp. HMSC062A02]OHO45147.1 hypothetical protein HMPREF2705_00975 [Aerococcus sp. HMSC035B07]
MTKNEYRLRMAYFVAKMFTYTVRADLAKKFPKLFDWLWPETIEIDRFIIQVAECKEAKESGFSDE